MTVPLIETRDLVKDYPYLLEGWDDPAREASRLRRIEALWPIEALRYE